MTKGVKKTKDNGATNLQELFLYTEIRVYLKNVNEAAHVNGVLLDFDDSFLYLGDIDEGINTAIPRESVGCIVTLDAIIKQEFAMTNNSPGEGELN